MVNHQLFKFLRGIATFLTFAIAAVGFSATLFPDATGLLVFLLIVITPIITYLLLNFFKKYEIKVIYRKADVKPNKVLDFFVYAMNAIVFFVSTFCITIFVSMMATNEEGSEPSFSLFPLFILIPALCTYLAIKVYKKALAKESQPNSAVVVDREPTPEEIALKKEQELFALRMSNFTETRRLHSIVIDEANKLFYEDYGNPNVKPQVYKFSEVLNYSLSKTEGTVATSTTVKKGGVGRAVVGGALFGAAGAVVGANTAKQQTTTKFTPGMETLSVYLSGDEIGYKSLYFVNPYGDLIAFFEMCKGCAKEDTENYSLIFDEDDKFIARSDNKPLSDEDAKYISDKGFERLLAEEKEIKSREQTENIITKQKLNKHEAVFFNAFAEKLTESGLNPGYVKLDRLSSGTFNIYYIHKYGSCYVGKIHIPESFIEHSYKIVKEGNTRATRVFNDETEALRFIEGKPEYKIEHIERKLFCHMQCLLNDGYDTKSVDHASLDEVVEAIPLWIKYIKRCIREDKKLFS